MHFCMISLEIRYDANILQSNRFRYICIVIYYTEMLSSTKFRHVYIVSSVELYELKFLNNLQKNNFIININFKKMMSK